MNIALVQLPIVWEDKAANFQLVREMLAGVDYSGSGGLIVLPELFATGFTMDSETFAEGDDSETETFLLELAAEKGAHVIGGVAKQKGSGFKPSNCAVVAAPNGTILCRYQKTHPFSLGGENENYSQGEKIETVMLNGFNVSPSVCYDLRFPEVYRIGAYSDTHLYVVIANWPEKRNYHWTTLLKARAIENQAYIVGVNRCGEDPNLTYAGSTMLVDYMGEIVVDAGSEPGVIEASIDLSDLQDWRDNFPALKDMHDSLSN